MALAAGVPIPDDVVAVPALVAAPAAVPTFNLAPTLIRAPAHDSASIEHHRLGGNFAYAVAEAHAYAQVTPQVSTITHPVAETTFVHEPATIARVVPGAVTTVNHIPHPIIEHQPILAQEPIVQVGSIFKFFKIFVTSMLKAVRNLVLLKLKCSLEEKILDSNLAEFQSFLNL